METPVYKQEMCEMFERHVKQKYATQTNAAENYGIRSAYVSDVCRGVHGPTVKMLDDMGYERVTAYRKKV